MASPDQTSPELDATRVEPSGGSATGVEAPADERGLDLARGMQVGRYLVLDSLGAGGMGEVFSAYDPDLDRRVALKLVKFGAREDAELARSRLLREAQALAKLSHPNVVAVYDAGTHGDRVFIAMEYVQGHTLRRWISEAAEREAAPSWRVALELMLQAGRGLAAAHAQGLVHRDFKPANVMVSEDGRVRVLDFGLARRFGENDSLPPQVELVVESLDGASGPRSSLELQLTQTGMVMGTPAYMAPEQFFGGHIDARTDQFAFCVVLYRVLFGLRPFVGESYRELGRAVARGELREMPKAARVPRSIQAAVRRGLSVGRDDRFASMDELLDALERGAGEGRRRRMLAGTGALLLAGLGTAGLLGRQGERAPAPCQGAEAKLEGIWDDDRRAAVRAAFEATALPYAEDARVAVERALDEHLGRWVELRTEVCEATRVRGDQSEALMDLRIGCLDGKLRDVVALTEVLAQADADVVKNATNGAQQLPSPDECATLDRTASSLLRPDDPAVATEVEAARRGVARARARLASGKYEEALREVEAASERARATGYEPAIAEALVVEGQAHERRVAPELARTAYEEALYSAEATGHQHVEVEALLGLVSVVGLHEADTADALRYGRQAEAVIRHLGGPRPYQATLAVYRGNTLQVAAELEAAAVEYAGGAELAKDAPGAERTRLAALNNLAAVHGQQGRYREAAAAFRAALALAEAQGGKWHPNVGMCLNNLGVTDWRLGDNDRAMQHLRRALEIYERVLSPDNPELGRGYHNLGVVQKDLGDYEGARVSYERALQIKRAGLGPDHPTVATTANNLGDALIALGRAEDAIPYAEDAIRIWSTALGPDNPTTVLGYLTLGQAQLALERPEDAVVVLRKALALAEAGQIDPIEVVRVQLATAKAVWRSGGEPEEALTLARKARDGYRASERDAPDELAEIEGWIASPS